MSVSIKIKGKSPLQRGMGISGNHSLLDWIGSFGAEDIGIDIGTSNVVFYIKRKGIVFPEAAVVARNKVTGSYLVSGTGIFPVWRDCRSRRCSGGFQSWLCQHYCRTRLFSPVLCSRIYRLHCI